MDRVSGGFVDHAGRRVWWERVGGADGDVESAVSAAARLVDGAGELRLRRRRLFGLVWSSVTVVGPPRVRWPRVAVGRRSLTVCWRWRMVMVHVARGDRSGRV